MDERKDRKIGVKLICVLLAFSLWLYIINVENPNRTVAIKNVPVEILNEDTLENLGLILSSKENLTVDLKVEGPATKVYSISKKDFHLSVDLSDYALKEGENTIPVDIVDYPDGVNIKSKDIISVKINIDKLVKKNFLLSNKVNVSYADGFSAASTVIEPSEIEVYGPKKIVNKVDSVAIVGEVNNVSKDYSEYFQICAFDKNGYVVSGVEFSKEKAKLIISTNKHKEVNVKINYVGNLKENYEIVDEVISETKINIFGNSDSINNIDEIETEPIDLSTITGNVELKCKLIVPDGVETEKKTVTITLTIEDKSENEIIENSYDVKINYIDKKEEFQYEGPETVVIKLKGKKSDLDKITTNNITVEASLKDIVEVGNEISVQWNATLQNATNVTLSNTSGTIAVNVKTKA